MGSAANDKTAVGIIGLGIMGMAMAKNARSAGFDVRVFNRSAARREAAEKAGLSVSGSIKELTEASDAVVVMVTDPAAVRSVLSGKDGVFSVNVKGKTLIQMSTIDEPSTMEFSRLAEEKGMSYLDCPVAGSKKQVEAAQLIILAGGDEADIARWKPFFDAVGKTTVTAGGIGKGTALKLCMNLIVAQMTTALCESVALARVQGLAPEKVFEVLKNSPALDCGYYRIKEETVLTENFAAAFSLENMLKDVRFMDAAAKKNRLNIPVTQAVKYVMEAAVTAGHGPDDLASILTVLKPFSSK